MENTQVPKRSEKKKVGWGERYVAWLHKYMHPEGKPTLLQRFVIWSDSFTDDEFKEYDEQGRRTFSTKGLKVVGCGFVFIVVIFSFAFLFPPANNLLNRSRNLTNGYGFNLDHEIPEWDIKQSTLKVFPDKLIGETLEKAMGNVVWTTDRKFKDRPNIYKVVATGNFNYDYEDIILGIEFEYDMKDKSFSVDQVTIDDDYLADMEIVTILTSVFGDGEDYNYDL